MTRETEAYVAITRLQAAYADVVTRRAWADLDGLFAPDTPIHIDTVTRPAFDLVGPAALGEFVSGAIERFEFVEFVILNTVVDVTNEDEATGRLWMVEVRQERGSGEWSNAFGLYRDNYARYDGRWRFTRRSYRSIARRIGTDPAAVFT
jgi:hypothetical protein